MKIGQDVRKFAAKQGMSEQEVLAKGMEVKSVKFVKQVGGGLSQGLLPCALGQTSRAF